MILNITNTSGKKRRLEYGVKFIFILRGKFFGKYIQIDVKNMGTQIFFPRTISASPEGFGSPFDDTLKRLKRSTRH